MVFADLGGNESEIKEFELGRARETSDAFGLMLKDLSIRWRTIRFLAEACRWVGSTGDVRTWKGMSLEEQIEVVTASSIPNAFQRSLVAVEHAFMQYERLAPGAPGAGLWELRVGAAAPSRFLDIDAVLRDCVTLPQAGHALLEGFRAWLREVLLLRPLLVGGYAVDFGDRFTVRRLDGLELEAVLDMTLAERWCADAEDVSALGSAAL